MLIIGHRGAAKLAPENTIESFRAGLAAGADILEFDVRLTKDSIPIVIHDANTSRTHRARVLIANYTYAEIDAMKLSPRIPLLTEILDEFFDHIILNIELKGRGTGKVVTKLIATRYITKPTDWKNVLISSFRAKELIAARKVSSKVPLAMLHNQNPFLFIAYERRLHFSAIGFHRLYVNPLALEIAIRIHALPYVYTVDRPAIAKALKARGIEGFVTNHPDILRSGIESL